MVQGQHVNQAHVGDAKAFFDDMVENLRYDEQLFHNDIMRPEQKNMYDTMIAGNIEALSHMARQSSFAYFAPKLLTDYLKELLSSKQTPKKIAFELSDSKILVWAEIFENDEQMENALILAQAKINAQYSEFGFHISSTIVEDSDGLEVPSHYKTIPIKEQ